MINKAGNSTIFFTPVVLSAFGAMVPLTVTFLMNVYARAKAAGKFKTAGDEASTMAAWYFGTCASAVARHCDTA